MMGSYGIGPARIVAAAIEQGADERGIVWPKAIAPWSVHVVGLGKAGEETAAEAERIYEELVAAGVEAVLDDRDAGNRREAHRRRAPRLPAAADRGQAGTRRGRGRDPGAANRRGWSRGRKAGGRSACGSSSHELE